MSTGFKNQLNKIIILSYQQTAVMYFLRFKKRSTKFYKENLFFFLALLLASMCRHRHPKLTSQDVSLGHLWCRWNLHMCRAVTNEGCLTLLVACCYIKLCHVSLCYRWYLQCKSCSKLGNSPAQVGLAEIDDYFL